MLKLYLNNKLADISDNVDISITYQLEDLSDPQAVKNDYSKTVTLEGTPNNNRIFGSIYRSDKEITNSTELAVGNDFNPNLRVPFYIQRDGDTIESGYFKLDAININDHHIQYDITLYGGLGDFFYNLEYDDNEDEITLASLDYGIEGFSTEEENNNNLFEYNKDFVLECWNTRCGKVEHSDNSLYSMFCPIPSYQGYYDDFSNDTVLEYKTPNRSEVLNNYLPEKVTEDETNYYPLHSHYKTTEYDTPTEVEVYPVTSAREMSDYEVGDIRSHNIPLGVRIQAIYDAIKNPNNNGGYEVDDSQLDDKSKLYLKDGYVMLKPFDFEDINETNKSVNINLGTDTLIVKNNEMDILKTTNSITFDVSEYVNPHLTVSIMPEVSTSNGETASSGVATIWAEYMMVKNKEEDQHYTGTDTIVIDTDSGYRWCVFGTLQGYYITTHKADGTEISRSDVITAYNRQIENKNTTLTDSGIKNITYYGYGGKSSKDMYFGLDKQIMTRGQLTWQGLNYLRNKMADDLGIDSSEVNISYNLSNDYYNNDKYYLQKNTGVNRLNDGEFVAIDPVTFNMEIDKETSFIQVHMIETTIAKAYEPKTKTYVDLSNYPKVDASKYLNSYAYFDETNQYLIDGRGYIGTTDDENITQVYDGSIASNDKRHVLTKTHIFSDTETPFNYLISLGKTFNWIFEKDIVEKKIRIYSKNNYFDRKILNINSLIDRSNISITPTPIEYNRYKVTVPLLETYQSDLFKKKNGVDYGCKIYRPNYQFSSEEKDLLEDSIFTVTIPYTEHSVFFTDTDIPVGCRGASFTCKYYQSGEDDGTTDYKAKGAQAMENSVIANTNDDAERLCFFDDEYANVECDNTFVLYNGYQDRTDMRELWLSDYYPMIESINDDDCYVNTSGYLVQLSLNDETTFGIVQRKIDYMPLFNNFSEADNISLVSGSEYIDYDNIWDLYFKNDITNIFNKNSKIFTTKMRIKDRPNEMIKHFYYFDNAVWLLNKITDWQPEGKALTEVEFIKLTDYENYCKSNDNTISYVLTNKSKNTVKVRQRKSEPEPTPVVGDYDVKLTFEDGSTQTDTYEDGIIPNQAYSGSSAVTVEIGDGITSIGDDAFYNCYSLSSITIPNSVTSIGWYAFYNCRSLTSVTIPNNVTSIGSYAFYNCYSLSSITIPDSVTSIWNSAFNNCTSLTSIIIPNSVIAIGNSAFNNCTSLTSIIIPNSVIAIGDMAFYYCRSLTSVTIPDSVTSIGDWAFYYCRSLTSVTIPNSVTSIGVMAFEGCTGLTSVTISDSVTSIDDGAFFGCTSLTSVTIPNSVTSIGYDAFANCTGLTSVTIPDSVTSIGHSAFYYCCSLTSVTIPNNVTSIGYSAFASCSSLTSISYTSTMSDWNNITFGYDWNYNVPATVVHCTDGDISIS